MVVLSESQGFNNVLYANLNKLAEERPMFKVLFGYTRDIVHLYHWDCRTNKNVDCDTYMFHWKWYDIYWSDRGCTFVPKTIRGSCITILDSIDEKIYTKI